MRVTKSHFGRVHYDTACGITYCTYLKSSVCLYVRGPRTRTRVIEISTNESSINRLHFIPISRSSDGSYVHPPPDETDGSSSRMCRARRSDARSVQTKSNQNTQPDPEKTHNQTRRMTHLKTTICTVHTVATVAIFLHKQVVVLECWNAARRDYFFTTKASDSILGRISLSLSC